MNLKTLSALAGSIMMLLTALPIMADDVSYQQARALREAGAILPLERIIEIAKTIKPGEVIDTGLEEDDGLYEYEIEILDANGRVWEMEFDAATGELMDLELDD
ncbi:PepSY domain-containing protein [Methylophaga sp. OBS3]|uniref:PepSY domain-containing protein n=1 Tax=Methylophaga sp. OBS3 TaxID=2991934 RepID=UPI0022546F36|nr:PepSY domain-containing protein [Methylophaga sp. OBS3]MCX4189665.1 PepSY domain-containing protein [Methylophaga sp. OBS3]